MLKFLHFYSFKFLSLSSFLKFINKCQAEILRCAPSSHVCGFCKHMLVFFEDFEFRPIWVEKKKLKKKICCHYKSDSKLIV